MPVSLWTYWWCCRGVGSTGVSYMPVFTRIEATMSKRVKLILEIERGRAKYPSCIPIFSFYSSERIEKGDLDLNNLLKI